MKLTIDEFPTSVGRMLCALNEDGTVVLLSFLDAGSEDAARARELAVLTRRGHDCNIVAGCARQVRAEIDALLRGARREFDFPFTTTGTEFQERVWRELRRVPYGATVSYAELARRIGQPSAVRAPTRRTRSVSRSRATA